MFSSLMNNYNMTIRIMALNIYWFGEVLHLFKNHAIKLYAKVQAQNHALVTSALVQGVQSDCLVSHSGRFMPM
jgi:hypothetical protein